MSTSIKTSLLITLSILFVACQTEEEIIRTSDRITFNTITYNTKASSFTSDNANPVKSMGIYAAATGDDTFNPDYHTVTFLDNAHIQRTSANTDWFYNNPPYWPQGYVTFFGYAPHGAASSIDASGTGAPLLAFKVADEQSKQVDLLIAKPAANKSKTTSAITMEMRHALTKVTFSARLSHHASEAEAIEAVRISNIELLGVYAGGQHHMDILAADGWKNRQDLRKEDRAFKAAIDNGLNNIELHDTYQPISSPQGALFMIPQSLTGEREGIKARLRVYVEVTWTDNNIPGTGIDFIDPIEFELENTGLDWQSGEAINYMINVDITDHTIKKSTIAAQIVDWDEIDQNVGILNRELKVTQIETNVNEGAVTRVFFWSNQPYVWIDAEGKRNENGYPTGTSFAVNSIFTDLALALNPGNSFPSQYDSYNNTYNLRYDPVSGEGYFDVESDVLSTANESYHIFVCASNDAYTDKPLRRSVRLNKFIDRSPISRNITTRYIGVFHRGHETGERIITWNDSDDGDWTAVIETSKSGDEWGDNRFDDYTHVLMDRFISPAEELGILYTDNPGNPEDYQVYPWTNELGGVTADGRRWISGPSKVYLRIGWDSKAPGAPFANPPGSVDIPHGEGYRNRYARITIRNGKNNPNGTILQTLYLRQGELADYVMTPGADGYYPDPNITPSPWSIRFPSGEYTYTGSKAKIYDRPYAQRIPPYNLSDPRKGVGGRQLSAHNTLLPREGVFADYPSQAGYLFRFNDVLTAFNPANPKLGDRIDAYPGDYNSNNPWDPQRHETCPPGYRRPSEYYAETSADYDFSRSEFTQTLFEQPAANKLYNGDGITDIAGLINSQQGWYADGFFDRRKIVGAKNEATQVGEGGEVAYFGSLFFNKRTLASVFMTHAGDRLPRLGGGLEWPGESGLYWSDSQHNANFGYAWGLDFFYSSYSSRFAVTYYGYKGRAHAVRCVKETIITKRK